MSVLTITKENFEQEVLNSDIPVLIDFWASWCGPCKMFAPTIDEFAKEAKSVKVCKINIDEENSLAEQYGVMSIPTVVCFKNGKEYKRLVGVQPIDNLFEMVE